MHTVILCSTAASSANLANRALYHIRDVLHGIVQDFAGLCNEVTLGALGEMWIESDCSVSEIVPLF